MRVPHGRPWKIAIIFLPEDDMGDEAVLPLRLEQGLNFFPGAITIKGIEAQGDESGIPVPLKRIDAAIWDGIAPTIIPEQNIAGILGEGCRHN